MMGEAHGHRASRQLATCLVPLACASAAPGLLQASRGPVRRSFEIRTSARHWEHQALCSGRPSPRARDCAAYCRSRRAPAFRRRSSLAGPGQRQTGARRTVPRKQRPVRYDGDVASVLARRAREVEEAARRGRVTPAVRTKFQAVALLLRDERARVRAAAMTESRRAEQLRRLDGIATILATTAVRDPGLLALLAEDCDVSDAARSLKREMLRDLGIEPAPEELAPTETATAPVGSERRVVP